MSESEAAVMEPALTSPSPRGLLEHPFRHRLFARIQEVPGIHQRRLARELGCSISNVEHHLRVLSTAGLVQSNRVGKRRAFFVSDEVELSEQDFLYFLRNRPARRILLALMANAQATLSELCAVVRVTPSTVLYHLQKLRAAGIVQGTPRGRSTVYGLAAPERVASVYEKYRATFQPLP